MANTPLHIGVLALQGSIDEHINHISSLGHIPVKVRTSNDLDNLDRLIIPGGESTTIGNILRSTGLLDSLKDKISKGLKVWGTCAGMILLAKEIENETISHLSLMDIKVKRNAYGNQLDSFITYTKINEVSPNNLELVFIRAPYISEISDKVTILCKIDENIVAAKENNMLVTSFHPELTSDTTFLKYFIEKF
ncbi:pyridoxal 5'-phosphate synthase glutaminase subunit PdxT [Clostridium gasigenes]|uniref:pyridoxal 5'-phosphate synthase glutaminase subunit PdxT n=1 Tax=Clostridium gasigenes TaxID=94869 RepID=UPI0014383AFF|nr:pyridoxal 5'-phosphate synthase glutaminase subunit PdxT [Clostridium gasigenes]NKF08859.1 pyridoxal 5'-phosphate synthase glutaminase subunit PdxT [Clostridium gasigenes]QSW21402.1 pyridoxal 5'-phosphate synthase glutaminase subunit PdxT [Clostridium gasigenes]